MDWKSRKSTQVSISEMQNKLIFCCLFNLHMVGHLVVNILTDLQMLKSHFKEANNQSAPGQMTTTKWNNTAVWGKTTVVHSTGNQSYREESNTLNTPLV